jgi:prophage DNA circulation protein
MNWQQLSTTSHYKTAMAVKNEMATGNLPEAFIGIEALIQALSRSEKRALKSQLVKLMLHIIKWQSQPERRSLSWIASIKDAREEIADIQEETPSLNNNVIEELWNKVFIIAKRDAQAEMGKQSAVTDGIIMASCV